MPLYEKPHPGHEKHLCSKVAVGTTINEYNVLVRNPKFLCKHCGRAAAKAENLCDPIPL